MKNVSLSKFLSFLIGFFILAAIVMLIYVIANPVHNEKFTELYILGNDGKAEDYPSDFIMSDDKITAIAYGGVYDYTAKAGQVILGIVNHEQEKATYTITLQIDGQLASIIDEGIVSDNSGEKGITPSPLSSPIKGEANFIVVLEQGEKWEHEIGFAPQHIGDNQKVEFFLYKDGASTPEDTLHLWVNVKGE